MLVKSSRHMARMGLMQGKMAMGGAAAPRFFDRKNQLAMQSSVRHGTGAIGAGLAVVGAAGACQGIGSLFGGFVVGIARNPAAQQQMFAMTMMGFAMIELFGFISLGFAGVLLMSD